MDETFLAIKLKKRVDDDFFGGHRHVWRSGRGRQLRKSY